MTEGSIASRLRHVKEQKGWTAGEMAELIGMSRRTLESYMRKENAPLPGVEALRQIALGLRLSLDWLVLGEEDASLGAVLLVRLSAERAALPVLENLFEAQRRNLPVPEPVYLAQEIGAGAATNAQMLVSSGMISVEIAQLIGRSTKQAEAVLKAKTDELRAQLAELRDRSQSAQEASDE
jgi:transcriptional regulator with XRE-family HTH domain